MIPNFLRKIDFHSLTCHSEQVVGDLEILIYDHDFENDTNLVDKPYTMLVLPQHVVWKMKTAEMSLSEVYNHDPPVVKQSSFWGNLCIKGDWLVAFVQRCIVEFRFMHSNF